MSEPQTTKCPVCGANKNANKSFCYSCIEHRRQRFNKFSARIYSEQHEKRVQKWGKL